MASLWSSGQVLHAVQLISCQELYSRNLKSNTDGILFEIREMVHKGRLGISASSVLKKLSAYMEILPFFTTASLNKENSF